MQVVVKFVVWRRMYVFYFITFGKSTFNLSQDDAGFFLGAGVVVVFFFVFGFFVFSVVFVFYVFCPCRRICWISVRMRRNGTWWATLRTAMRTS